MIAILQIENFLQAQRFCHAFGVPLIVQNTLPRGAGPGHFIVGRADQIACVSLADKFGDCPARKDRYIVGMRLDGGEHFAGVRFAHRCPLDKNAFAAAVGKFIPGVPKLKANAMATYRLDNWAFTIGARYSDRSFGTIDNSDPISQTYQGFAGYFVADARVRYTLNENWNISLGVDNLNNDKYFLFHPFPQRTVFAELKHDF